MQGDPLTLHRACFGQLKNQQDATILCEELAKLDLVMVKTDGVHEVSRTPSSSTLLVLVQNERFEPEYDYSLVYHLHPHVGPLNLVLVYAGILTGAQLCPVHAFRGSI